MTTERIDVLRTFREFAVMDGMRIWPTDEEARRYRKSVAAVAELIEAAKLANGDHSAPHDCYATGPMTGDAYLDLVRCPGCKLAAALARVGAP